MMRRTLAVSLFLAASIAALWAAAQAFEAAQETRVSYKYISSALAPEAAAHETVKWRPAEAELVRPLTGADAVVIGRALQEAWQSLAVAQENNAPELLVDSFTGVARQRAALSVADAEAHGGRMIVLSQEATPVFFHKDGSLFQARIEMVVSRYLSDAGKLDTFHIARESGVATLLNGSNGWRLMSWERRTSEPLQQSAVSYSGKLVGLNYYPSETPWREFWPAFDAARIAEDFDRMADLNANCVRVFLTRDAFLGDDVGDTLEKLSTLLAAAEARNLKVIPTLFDLKQNYGLGTWADDSLYLERVLSVLRISPAVAFIDIKNEPDLDFEAHGAAKVQAWLRSMLALTRAHAPDHALTIGWSSAGAAETLINALDVITYHDYAPVEGASQRLSVLRAQTEGRPIYVTEIGESSYSLVASFPGSETTQADRLQLRFKALGDADGIMVWTLFDFPEVDLSVVGGSPWVKRLQSSFGTFRGNGTEKPAAGMLRTEFARFTR